MGGQEQLAPGGLFTPNSSAPLDHPAVHPLVHFTIMHSMTVFECASESWHVTSCPSKKETQDVASYRGRRRFIPAGESQAGGGVRPQRV